MSSPLVQGILASVSGLLQGAASGAISRVEFDRKLKEEAAKSKLLEAQIRNQRVSPQIAGAIGQRAAQAGITQQPFVGESGPIAPGQPVVPETMDEAKLLQTSIGQEQTMSFKQFQEQERTRRESLRQNASMAARSSKNYMQFVKDQNAEINRRVDNKRSEILAKNAGILTPEAQMELQGATADITQDVTREFKMAWVDTYGRLPQSHELDQSLEGLPQDQFSKVLERMQSLTSEQAKTFEVDVPLSPSQQQQVDQLLIRLRGGASGTISEDQKTSPTSPTLKQQKKGSIKG